MNLFSLEVLATVVGIPESQREAAFKTLQDVFPQRLLWLQTTAEELQGDYLSKRQLPAGA